MKGLAAAFIFFLAQGAYARADGLAGLDAAGIKVLAADVPAPVSDVEAAGPQVTLLLAADRADSLDPVWPGYGIFGQPILLCEAAGRSFLIAHPNPPEGYVPLISSPRAVLAKPGPVAGFSVTYKRHFQFNGADTFAYRYKDGESPAETLRMLVHERFHNFQQAGFADMDYAERSSEPDGEDLALAALEQAALRSALAAPGPETAAGYAAQFLAARGARYARLPDCRPAENLTDIMEGTAEYVSRALVLRPEVLPAPGGAAGAVAGLLKVFPEVDAMSSDRSYAVGAALGLLLDGAGRRDWKELAAAGTPLYDLALQTFPLPDPAAALREAKAEHGYAALLETGLAKAAAFQSARDAAISDYEGLPGTEWTVPSAGNLFHSAAAPLYDLDGGSTLMPAMRTIETKMYGYSLTVKDRPAILGTGRISFHASAEVLLDGEPFPLQDGARRFQSLSVTGPGLELSVSLPGTLKVAGRKAEITFY